VYYVIKNTHNIAIFSTTKCYIWGLTILRAAQTAVEGMANKLNSYSHWMFKEADVLKADTDIYLKDLRQIKKNLRLYRRCPD